MAIELRRNDYTLSEEQEQLSQMLRQLLSRHSPMEVVRAAEPLGFDRELWNVLAKNGLLGLSTGSDAESGGLVEVALAAFEIGRAAAPVPLVDHLVALRLFQALRAAGHVPDSFDWDAAASGDKIMSIAPISTWELGAELVPSGAIAEGVLAWLDTSLVLLTTASTLPLAANHGSAPLAWWDPAHEEIGIEILATGEEAVQLWAQARREWKVATAAALIGLTEGASEIARSYALERKAFGAPIAKFQAVSHQLVEIYMDVQTGRNLCLKAAWLTEHDRDHRPELPSIALAHATRGVLRSVAKALHVHGGFGITLEADITLFYRRASAWSLVSGGSRRDLEEISVAIDRIAEQRSSQPVPSATK